ncbi:MAG: hypothetical protein AAF654_14275 [Myxococcota bacterium]
MIDFASVGVVGLGYVGLPLSVAFGRGGLRCLGFDTDPTKPERINRGDSYLSHVPSEHIRQLVAPTRRRHSTSCRRPPTLRRASTPTSRAFHAR